MLKDCEFKTRCFDCYKDRDDKMGNFANKTQSWFHILGRLWELGRWHDKW